MNMSLYLSALINVFNVVPAFLLPVFSNGVQFFFQVLDNNTISCFEEADLSQFTEKTVYRILDRHLYKSGSPAIYGIDLPGGNYIYGNSGIIADAYFNNLLNFAEYPDFMQSMRDFLMETNIGRTIRGVPAALMDMNLICKYVRPGFMYSEEQGGKKPSDSRRMLSAGAHQITLKNLGHTYSVLLHKYEPIHTEVVENTVCAIYRPDKSFIKTHDIFVFRYLIKNPDTRYIAQYNKTASEIPVELQIELLDVLFQYVPKNYTPLLGMHRSSWELWDYGTTVQVFSSMCKQTDYLRPGLLKHYLMKLGIHIEYPKLSESDSGSDSADNCLIDLFSSIEETTNMEEAYLFWFEVKALSHNVYAILAQNYKTGRKHFRLKEDSLSSNDLIDFIVALSHDVLGKKVVLMRVRSEKFPHLFDDRLSDWLSENEDKCVIHDVYHDIREYYE